MNWPEKIMSFFTNQGSIYYVLDELSVLKQKQVVEDLSEKGIMLFEYDDVIEFRYFYEKNYRHTNKANRQILIVHGFDGQFNTLPHDVLNEGIRIDLSISRLFPQFDASVIQQCPRELFNKLYELQQKVFTKLNRKATIDYLLENAFSIQIESVFNSVSLFKMALAYYKQFEADLPTIFYERLIEITRLKYPFIQQDLMEIFVSRKYFEQFLNTQWQHFVHSKHQQKNDQIADGNENYGGQCFIDPYVQSNVIKFVKPVKVENILEYEEWMRLGLTNKEKEPIFHDEYELFKREDWLRLASRIGEEQATLLEQGILPNDFVEQVSKANLSFQQWMLDSYSSMRTLPILPIPKMVHQIPHYLSRKAEGKIALVVLDGMSFTQWYSIRSHLREFGFSFEEHAIFSWIPSVTSVARQSIFSGKEPCDFADTIDTTRREKIYWEQFWEQEGFAKQYVAYEKSLGLEVYNPLNFVYQQMPNVRVYGAVIDVIDQIMHGATQGLKTIQSELKTWLYSNYLVQFLSDLIAAGFDVYVTSDHGNVECTGRGRIPQGVTVETKGERFRTYQSEVIRNQTALDHPDTVMWNDASLPEGYFVLLANDKRAFTQKNDKIVTHGGIHVEEVIVPFVKVTR
ncbi:BREX-3 system phosphatase PglZ [Lysinibacillus capsici]|uniref:BREX-3 system phosphatase PglZ n=1 Tax=Lysinibacillus capsici TaxID=2115968 RepID=UPI001B4ABA8B|nr:BREX-3 system phosphatase PglZ [Lysinibacillus capsici]MCR6524419.1 BREX-3 system phosphatase PglZ [Lysinibacillus capsici]